MVDCSTGPNEVKLNTLTCQRGSSTQTSNFLRCRFSLRCRSHALINYRRCPKEKMHAHPRSFLFLTKSVLNILLVVQRTLHRVFIHRVCKRLAKVDFLSLSTLFQEVRLRTCFPPKRQACQNSSTMVKKCPRTLATLFAMLLLDSAPALCSCREYPAIRRACTLLSS
jgi:hypothetical protein